MNQNTVSLCYLGNTLNYVDHAAAIKEIIASDGYSPTTILRENWQLICKQSFGLYFFVGPSLFDLPALLYLRLRALLFCPLRQPRIIVYSHEPWPLKWLHQPHLSLQNLKILAIFAYQLVVFALATSICCPSVASQRDFKRLIFLRDKLLARCVPLPLLSSIAGCGFQSSFGHKPLTILFNQGSRAMAKGLPLFVFFASRFTEVNFIASLGHVSLDESICQLFSKIPNLKVLNYKKSLLELKNLCMLSDLVVVIGSEITQSAAACLAWSTGCSVATNLRLDLPVPSAPIYYLDIPAELLCTPINHLLAVSVEPPSLSHAIAQMQSAISSLANSNSRREDIARAYLCDVTEALHTVFS